MLPAHIAALELARRKAEESAEFARQLPLHQAEFAPWMTDPETGEAPRAEPDWASNY